MPDFEKGMVITMEKIEYIYQEMKAEFEFIVCADIGGELSDLEHARMLHSRREILGFTLLSGVYDMHQACMKDFVDFSKCCECLTMMTKMHYDTDYEITEVAYVIGESRSGDLFQEIETYSQINANSDNYMNFWNILSNAPSVFAKGSHSKLDLKLLYDYINFLEEAWWNIFLTEVKTDASTKLPKKELKEFLRKREEEIEKVLFTLSEKRK